MKLIGLAGKMGAGKDVIAQLLIDSGIGHQRVAFATGVKMIVYRLLDIPPTRKTKESRDARQFVGNAMRQYDPNIWINYLSRGMQYVKDADITTFVITDVRYKNEAEWILENDGTVIYVYAPPLTRKARIEKRDKITISDEDWKKWSEHPSEKELDSIRYMDGVFKLVNSVDVPKSQLKHMYQEWLKRLCSR